MRGRRGRLSGLGAALPLLALVTGRAIARGSQTAPDTEAHLALLRRNPLFAPLPLTALDRLSEGLVPVTFAPGDVVMREGDAGDRYVLIAEGEVEVSADGRHLRTCGPGDGIGEIALLRRVPRTASVVAKTDVSAFEIDGSAFLAAVSGPAAAAAAEAVATARLEHSQTQ